MNFIQFRIQQCVKIVTFTYPGSYFSGVYLLQHWCQWKGRGREGKEGREAQG